jgi:hypothetical protein
VVAYLLLYDRSDMDGGGVRCASALVPAPARGGSGVLRRSGPLSVANILLGNGDLMESLDQMDFRKNVAARHAVIEGLHVGQGVPVAVGMVTLLRWR